MRETAKRIGVPETTYREWEYGRAITGEPYPKIAEAFEITLEEVFGLDARADSPEEAIDRIISDLRVLKKRLTKPD